MHSRNLKALISTLSVAVLLAVVFPEQARSPGREFSKPEVAASQSAPAPRMSADCTEGVIDR
jgi:hypothetical protein